MGDFAEQNINAAQDRTQDDQNPNGIGSEDSPPNDNDFFDDMTNAGTALAGLLAGGAAVVTGLFGGSPTPAAGGAATPTPRTSQPVVLERNRRKEEEGNVADHQDLDRNNDTPGSDLANSDSMDQMNPSLDNDYENGSDTENPRSAILDPPTSVDNDISTGQGAFQAPVESTQVTMGTTDSSIPSQEFLDNVEDITNTHAPKVLTNDDGNQAYFAETKGDTKNDATNSEGFQVNSRNEEPVKRDAGIEDKIIKLQSDFIEKLNTAKTLGDVKFIMDALVGDINNLPLKERLQAISVINAMNINLPLNSYFGNNDLKVTVPVFDKPSTYQLNESYGTQVLKENLPGIIKTSVDQIPKPDPQKILKQLGELDSGYEKDKETLKAKDAEYEKLKIQLTGLTITKDGITKPLIQVNSSDTTIQKDIDRLNPLESEKKITGSNIKLRVI
ncbi:hypothetical protein [Leptospira bandrabouensis]|uniref:hypothetical protein n=1 Tax=Leptospira bandrabouensis TaxID=2484903 RepID=UPI001EEC18CD|nr:hypothetical protein [Leptospira bandrabouensis]MCG6150477.1 hypothetical protein [Leptospira bandrabouensis]